MNGYDPKSKGLIESFRDKEYRETYAEEYLNTHIATQIRVLREQRGMTQAQLAEAVGSQQTAISRMENVNNTARNIGTLLKIAFQLDCRLKVSFETFGSLINDCMEFSRETLQRPSFEQDPVFQGNVGGHQGIVIAATTGIVGGTIAGQGAGIGTGFPVLVAGQTFVLTNSHYLGGKLYSNEMGANTVLGNAASGKVTRPQIARKKQGSRLSTEGNSALPLAA